MFNYDVLCIGSATLDNFLVVEADLSKIKLGDKVLVAHQEVHSGGGGTNSAASFSKLGLKVKLLTKIGNDLAAEMVLKELKSYNFKIIKTARSRKPTDSSTILSSAKNKDRIIYVHKGASGDLALSDLKKSDLKANWIYLASLTGKSLKTGKEIVAYAKSKKIKLLFNPSLYLASLGKSRLKPFLDAATVLVLNKEEAQALVNSHRPVVNFQKPVEHLLMKLQEMGPSTVIITDGAKKLSAINNGIIYSLIPPKVKTVETAGAGDAFTSGFLAGVIKRYTFEDSLRLGQVNALSVIQHIGTKNKLLTEREARQLMNKFKIKINAQAL